MKPTDSRQGYDLASGWRDRRCNSPNGCVLPKPEMSSVFVIVEQIQRHQTFKMPLIQNDHVVKQVAPATSNPALRNSVLPWTAKGSASWLASHLPHSRNHFGSELCVSVEEQESVRLFVGPCFSQLLHNPMRIGILRHIEVQNLTPLMADHEKAIQNTKRERWNGEEVHRSNCFAMVPEECQPSLHHIWISL